MGLNHVAEEQPAFEEDARAVKLASQMWLV